MPKQSSFFIFLKETTAPLISLLYVVTIISTVKEKLADIGVQLFIFAVFLFSLLWTIFVWRTHKKNGQNRIIRYGSVLATLLVIIPFVVSIKFPPTIKFTIVNKTNHVIKLKAYHQFLIYTIEPNGFSALVGDGIVTLESSYENTQIDKNQTKTFEGHFANNKVIEEYISEGKFFISLAVNTQDSIRNRITSDSIFYLNRSNLKKLNQKMVVTN